MNCDKCNKQFKNKSGLANHKRGNNCNTKPKISDLINKITIPVKEISNTTNNIYNPVYMVIDTETTGLPQFKNKTTSKDTAYYDYTDHTKYNSSRIVQFSYQLFDVNQKLIKTVDNIIKPKGFKIPPNCVHNITMDIANKNSTLIEKTFEEFYNDLTYKICNWA